MRPARVEISNADKIFFPEDQITKRELVEYYARIAERMLPYTKGRAIILERFPDGITRQGFYQKDASDYFPEWIRRISLGKKGGSVEYVVGDNVDTFIYLANQGTITFHTWLSRTDRSNNPDAMIIDLDPSGSDFGIVIKGARAFRDVFAELGLKSFVKTTGSRGLHVVVPLDRSATFEEVRRFAAQVSSLIAGWNPEMFTMEHRKQNRMGRVFLDIGRNAYGQHAVAPFSVRARPGAPVATPISWDEVKSGLLPDKFTIRNVFRRLARKDDPWKDVRQTRQSISGPTKRLKKLT